MKLDEIGCEILQPVLLASRILGLRLLKLDSFSTGATARVTTELTTGGPHRHMFMFADAKTRAMLSFAMAFPLPKRYVYIYIPRLVHNASHKKLQKYTLMPVSVARAFGSNGVKGRNDLRVTFSRVQGYKFHQKSHWFWQRRRGSSVQTVVWLWECESGTKYFNFRGLVVLNGYTYLLIYIYSYIYIYKYFGLQIQVPMKMGKHLKPIQSKSSTPFFKVRWPIPS